MDFTGIDDTRLQFSWVSASEALKWVDLINKVTTQVKDAGPFMEYQGLSEKYDDGLGELPAETEGESKEC